MSEININVPSIFQRDDLSWFRYAETRRSRPVDMAGNVNDDPRVLNPETHALLKSPLPFEEWVRIEKQATDARIFALKSVLGVSTLARLRVAHGTDVISLNDAIDTTTGNIAVTDRPFFDASILSTPDMASMIPPADCIVATAVYPSERIVSQIHIGIRGLARGIAPQVLGQLELLGANPEDALIYLSPHAQGGFQLNAAETEEITGIIDEGSRDRKQEFDAHTYEGIDHLPIMDLTEFTLDQLAKAGVPPRQIQVSPQNTLTDPTLYSDLAKQEKGFTGRFGVVAGIGK